MRNGFVSNSSSSSFVIKLKDVSPTQLDEIVNYDISAKIRNLCEFYDEGWYITIDEDEVRGDTSMDNFDMVEFLHAIGVPNDKIEWDHN